MLSFVAFSASRWASGPDAHDFSSRILRSAACHYGIIYTRQWGIEFSFLDIKKKKEKLTRTANSLGLKPASLFRPPSRPPLPSTLEVCLRFSAASKALRRAICGGSL